ncbi:MAG TPA: hypothetical protein VFY73_13835 [Ideonella sp.]|uniref:hypothetical protein n=1 Tax=Ideonella sp. TaxID=1929293 RepID=UPI002E33BF36|nr:hypothetical protein [Ideonella sp.]HEX5685098.1 hypothetical protein [Ideonella sp.]
MSEQSLIRAFSAPRLRDVRDDARRAWMSLRSVAWTLLAIGSAWGVARALRLDAGSPLGYWIGVAGGLAMLALFLYPLRKRLPALRGVGATRHWFIFHMLMGVAGPWLILVHCNFRVGSLNATVALVSMLVVAGSGVIGRYLYVHVHQGLDDRHANLAELRTRLDTTHQKLAATLTLAPRVRDRLFAFEQAALSTRARNAPALLWLSARAARAARRDVRALIDQALAAAPATLAEPRRRQIRAHWRAQARLHVAQTLGVVQLRAWERLFSLWHVLHLPFVYVMVACAVTHVVAVHAY